MTGVHPVTPMKTPALVQGFWCGFALCAAHLAFGQSGLPATQPKMLTIVREDVKPGRGADHSKHESGWPAAYEKAKSPDYYLAMTSLTGSPQAWYVVPAESNAAIAETMKREDKDPVLSAELARLSLRDAEFISGVSILQAAGRPDLSFGTFPEIGKSRFFEIHTFFVRPGQIEKFEASMKAYLEVRKRVAPTSAGFRVYSVFAGMPVPTYLLFISVEDYAKFDQVMADHMKTLTSPNPNEKAEFDKWGDAVSRQETQRFRLDPAQSYVPKETRAQDPEFWMPK